MLVIRLARTGRAKYPTYRIVAAESARAATGKFVAVLGHYNPHTKELVIKREEVQKHLSHGAQPSNTVIKLLAHEKIDLPEWVKLKTKAPKKVETPAEEAPANAGKPEAKDDAAKPEANAVKPEAKAADETAAEAPAAEPAEVRVAEVNEDEAIAAEASAPDADATETAASEEAAAESK